MLVTTFDAYSGCRVEVAVSSTAVTEANLSTADFVAFDFNITGFVCSGGSS